MTFDGAVVTEQGVTFAIVVVNSSATSNQNTIANAQRDFSSFFPNIPIILMHQDANGVPTYYGRKDIVEFLANVCFEQIPWQRYTA